MSLYASQCELLSNKTNHLITFNRNDCYEGYSSENEEKLNKIKTFCWSAVTPPSGAVNDPKFFENEYL